MWFKMDDKFHSSEPVKRMSRDIRSGAVGLFALAGTWSADNLKDGYVPVFMVEELGCTLEQAEALVEVKLWRRVRDGYRFREWAPWQPMRAEVEANRKAERDRKAAYRQKTAQSRGDVPHHVPPGQIQNPGYSVPSRPDPTKRDNYSSVDTSPNRAEGSEEHSSTGGENPVDNYPTALIAVAERMSSEIGREFTVLEAGPIVDWILERSKTEVKLPRRYVRAALNRDWAVWSQYATTGRFPE